MKAIRILSFIGLFVSFLGFLVGIGSMENTTKLGMPAASSWIIFLSLYLAALCIVNLSVIKVKTRDDKIKKLEADLKAVKEKISTPEPTEEEAEKEKETNND